MSDCGCTWEGYLCKFHAQRLQDAAADAYEWMGGYAPGEAPEAHSAPLMGSMQCHGCGGTRFVYRGVHVCPMCDHMVDWPNLAGQTFYDQEGGR